LLDLFIYFSFSFAKDPDSWYKFALHSRMDQACALGGDVFAPKGILRADPVRLNGERLKNRITANSNLEGV